MELQTDEQAQAARLGLGEGRSLFPGPGPGPHGPTRLRRGDCGPFKNWF